MAKRAKSSRATVEYARDRLRAAFAGVVRVHRWGYAPELVVPNGRAVGAADFDGPEHKLLVAESAEQLMAGALAESLLEGILDAMRYAAEAERVRLAPPPIADVLEPERRPESTNLRPALPSGVSSPSSRPTAPPPAETPDLPEEYWDDEHTPVRDVDFSGAVTTPAFTPLPMDQRPVRLLPQLAPVRTYSLLPLRLPRTRPPAPPPPPPPAGLAAAPPWPRPPGQRPAIKIPPATAGSPPPLPPRRKPTS